MTDLIFLRAAEATEDILHNIFGIRVVSKKKENPLEPDGFLAFVRGLGADLKREAANAEAQGLAEALRMLEVDWAKMTPKQRGNVVLAAEKAIGAIAPKVSPKIKQTLLDEGQTIVEATRRAAAGKYDLSIDAALALGDEKMVQALAASQALFVTDEYGRRADALSVTTRTIVSSGLARGLDQYAIGEELRLAVGAQLPNRADAYWDVVASIYVARSRTWGQLSSFDDAGIAAWEFVAVLDEDTSEVCRFMDGRVFSVRGAKTRYEQVAAAEDPEQVKALQPFVQVGRDDEGRQYLYYRQGETRVPVAQVDAAGTGKLNERGAYSRAMGDEQLEAAGIGPPPLHGHCRSEIVPAEGVAAVAVPAATTPAQRPRPVAPRPKPSVPSLPPTLPAPAPPRPVPVPQIPSAPALPVVVVEPTPVVAVPIPLPTIEPAFVGGMKAGVHVKNVVGTGVDAARAGEIFAAIDDDGLLKYLAENPVHTIAFDPDRKGSGAYKYSTQTLTLKSNRERDSYGRKLKPGESFSISKTAKTELEAIQSTLLHELGHHVQGRGSNATIDAIVEKAFAESPSAITKYGNTEPLEYFAESFAAYYRAPYALKKHDQIGYRMVEDVLRERGIIEAKPKRPKLPRAAVVPAAPPPPPRASAANILHQRTGEAQGSNAGGFYRGADGVERYVKFYDDPAQAHCEHLANLIYQDLGHDAPTSMLFEHHGKIAYASELLPGGKTLAEAGLTKPRAEKVLRGFVGDVLTANWDAVGTGLDNIVVLHDGRLVRIDNGGTFLMRAKAGRKDATLLNAISEWKAFFDPNINEYYAKVATKAGVSDPLTMRDVVAGEIRRVLALREDAGSWAAYVAARIPDVPAQDRARIIHMLEARSSLLEAKLAELEAAAAAPAAAKEVVFSESSPLGRKVFDKLAEFASGTPYTRFYDDLYEKAGVPGSEVRLTQQLIGSWTGEFRSDPTHRKVYEASRALIAGDADTQSAQLMEPLKRLSETRAQRWKAFFEAIGETDAEAPTHFELHRGVKGMDWVLDVARAWEAGDTHINVRSDEVASWSLRRTRTVEKFAGVAYYNDAIERAPAGVVHKWKASVNETLVDQVVDDATFISGFHEEHEAVAGHGHSRGVNVVATDAEVFFDGNAYTYADRAALLRALRAAGKL